jgi:hypothetical protein
MTAITDNKQDEEYPECRAVVCNKKATMSITVAVTFDFGRDTMIDEVPYCDEHTGWFYRSFSRPSYSNVEVVGINILLDCDTEFARIQSGS